MHHYHTDSWRRHRPRSRLKRVRIIEASGVEIQWETHYAGAQALEKFGETLPKELLESIKRNKVALKGPITTPIGKGFTSVNVGLRKALDLYATAAGASVAKCSVSLSRTRSGRRPRKHGEFVRRTRARSGSRCRREFEDHHRESFDAHRSVCFRVCEGESRARK